MVMLARILAQFKPFRALVIGDVLCDHYVQGQVQRVSPEAPVCVLQVQNKQVRPGGAGNVALNLHALGGDVFVLGRIGLDSSGLLLKQELQKNTIHTEGLFTFEDFHTPTKTRFLSAHQQMLRVDEETIVSLTQQQERAIVACLPHTMQAISVIAISDYRKGFLTDTLLAEIMRQAHRQNIPVVVDPKGQNFQKYKGAYLLKPNESEAYKGVDLTGQESLECVAEKVFTQTDVAILVITKSKDGISLFTRAGSRKDFLITSKEVIDVTGAGDTVLSTLCAAIANKIDIAHAVQLANVAAGIAVEKLGCARVRFMDIANRLMQYHAAPRPCNIK
jgi:rfaE bifunctional protein kinase chain/domain